MAPSQSKHSRLPHHQLRHTLHHLITRYLTVQSADIVRQTLNRGLLLVIAGFEVLAIGFLLFLVLNGATFQLQLVMIALVIGLLPIARLAQRGGVGGALALTVLTMTTNAASYDPASYTQPVVIHTNFLVPAIIAALFWRPVAGFAAAIGQTLLLAAAMAAQQSAPPLIVEFTVLCLIDLLGATVPIYVAAQLFIRSVNRLATVNSQLDITVAERTAELQRVMQLREHEISAVVHDLKNRMHTLRATVDLLVLEAQDAGIASATLQEADTRAKRSIDAIGRMVEDLQLAVLIDNSRLRLVCTPLDLAALVQQTVADLGPYAEGTNCQMHIETAPLLPRVLADRQKIERVIWNLLENALKYTHQARPHGGLVSLHLHAVPGGVELSIRDNGPGLTAESLARLGQPFTRLASARGTEGSGIGIYISRGVVASHGGRLHYHSDGPGHGTTVTLWLPAAPS